MAGFLEKDVRDATGPDGRRADAGAANFHARVAANVLRIVERELRDTTADEVTDALGALGFTDEMELAKATRGGLLDGRSAELLPVLRTVVRHRLDIAHPGYAE